MKKKDNKTVVVGVRLTPDEHYRISKAAYDARRPVSNWIEMACLWALENNAVNEKPRPLKKKGAEDVR